MIDCALVDRESSQIVCPQSERARAGSDDRTRKRARGEAPEDYAKRDAFKAARGTRERLQSAPTASITAHFFSIVYYALINVTRELALKPIYTNAPRVYVFGPHAASDDELRARIELYDRGVNPELFVNLRNPLCWIPYNEQYLVCPSVGEVMLTDTSQLLGAFCNGKIRISLGDTRPTRAHLILESTGRPRPSSIHTADHTDFRLPLNDSINNLQWALKKSQALNRRKTTHVRSFAQPIEVTNTVSGKKVQYASMSLAGIPYGLKAGSVFYYLEKGVSFQGKFVFTRGETSFDGVVLPVHHLASNFQCTSTGMFRTLDRTQSHWTVWRYSSPAVASGRGLVHFNGRQTTIYRVMVESALGRGLLTGEEVDHTDGDFSNNNLSNLMVVTGAANLSKQEVHFITCVETLNVYGGVSIAASSANIHAPGVSACLRGVQNKSGGYSWRDSTVDEVEHFFRAMDALEDLPAAVASLASHPRHGELVRALELRREREAALARLGLCDPPVGWVRGTDASSGLSFYHREETGECRWRNPTLTRLGL